MYAKNVNMGDLVLALKRINNTYEDNVIFNCYPEWYNDKIKFTLKVKDSSKPGARHSYSGRKGISACWHVHGDFFDELFKINPNAIIESGWTKTKTITKDSGNWQEIQSGTMAHPVYLSALCYCD